MLLSLGPWYGGKKYFIFLGILRKWDLGDHTAQSKRMVELVPKYCSTYAKS